MYVELVQQYVNLLRRISKRGLKDDHGLNQVATKRHAADEGESQKEDWKVKIAAKQNKGDDKRGISKRGLKACEQHRRGLTLSLFWISKRGLKDAGGRYRIDVTKVLRISKRGLKATPDIAAITIDSSSESQKEDWKHYMT